MWCGGWWTQGELLATYDGTIEDGWDAGHMLPSNAHTVVVTSDMFWDDVAKKEMLNAVRHNKDFRLATKDELSDIQMHHQLPVLMAVVHR